MFTSYVLAVLLLQAHQLKVSFSTNTHKHRFIIISVSYHEWCQRPTTTNML